MKKIVLILSILLSSTVMFSQKVKVIEGDFKNLKGIAVYNLKFDYTGVQIPKYDSEEAFFKG